MKLSGPIASALWKPEHQFSDSCRRNTITQIFPPHLNRRASIKLDNSYLADSDEILLDTVMEDIPEELALLCVVETKESNGHIDVVRGFGTKGFKPKRGLRSHRCFCGPS